eukprot:1139808-Pelagomonas_calceolata.AAC.4
MLGAVGVVRVESVLREAADAPCTCRDRGSGLRSEKRYQVKMHEDQTLLSFVVTEDMDFSQSVGLAHMQQSACRSCHTNLTSVESWLLQIHTHAHASKHARMHTHAHLDELQGVQLLCAGKQQLQEVIGGLLARGQADEMLAENRQMKCW